MLKRPLICASVLSLLLTTAAVGREYRVFDVVGDSISAGYNPEHPSYGWVDMLFGESLSGEQAKSNTIQRLWPDIDYYNSSISGSRASGWANDKDGSLSAVKSRHPDLVVVFVGGNDMLDYLDDGLLSQVELDQYRHDLTSIITNLLDNQPVPDIVLSTYYDMFDGYSENLAGPLTTYTNVSAATIAGNQVIREVGMATGCYVVDGVHEEFLHHAYGSELGDEEYEPIAYMERPLAAFDIHPVTAGHSELHDLIFEKLEYLKQYAVPEQWMLQFGLSNYAADASLDPDADGMPTWKEYIAGTIPTNAASLFRIELDTGPDAGHMISWEPVSNRVYDICWSTNLADGFHPLETNLTGNSFFDAVHTNPATYYRIDVRLSE